MRILSKYIQKKSYLYKNEKEIPVLDMVLSRYYVWERVVLLT